MTATYATVDDLKARLVEMYAKIYRGDDTLAQQDLDAAQAEIDAKLAARYVVPVTDPAATLLLKDWTLTLTEGLSYARASGPEYTGKVKDRIKAVRDNLLLAIAGKLKIGNADPNPADAASVSVISGERPVFTRPGMEGY